VMFGRLKAGMLAPLSEAFLDPEQGLRAEQQFRSAVRYRA
jgi:hypothetical protein